MSVSDEGYADRIGKRWPPEKWEEETIKSTFISQGQTSTSFPFSDNPEQTALYSHSVLSPFGCPGYSPRGVMAAWGACLASAGRCEPRLHVWLTSISWSKIPFSKGSSQSNSDKYKEARRLLPTDQVIPMIFLTTNDKQLRSTWTWECNLSKTRKEKQSFN